MTRPRYGHQCITLDDHGRWSPQRDNISSIRNSCPAGQRPIQTSQYGKFELHVSSLVRSISEKSTKISISVASDLFRSSTHIARIHSSSEGLIPTSKRDSPLQLLVNPQPEFPVDELDVPEVIYQLRWILKRLIKFRPYEMAVRCFETVCQLRVTVSKDTPR